MVYLGTGGRSCEIEDEMESICQGPMRQQADAKDSVSLDMELLLLVLFLCIGASVGQKGSDESSVHCALFLLRPNSNGSRRLFLHDGAEFPMKCVGKGQQNPDVPEEDIQNYV